LASWLSPEKSDQTFSPMGTPAHFSDLSEADQLSYEQLQRGLSGCKNRRNKSVEIFRSVLDRIKEFVTGGDGDNRKRALVCGICFFENSIAINTHQFRVLTGRCKSSINGLFMALGYGTLPSGSSTMAPLVGYFRALGGTFGEMRQWTIRQKLSPVVPLITQGVQPKTTAERRYLIPPITEDRAGGFRREVGVFPFPRIVN
jgi:hypothetical protein